MKQNIDHFHLVIFGDYNVLTNTPFRDRQPLHMLLGRVRFLAHLREDRSRRGGPDLRYAVAGNKGGVAFGLQTEDEATEEVRWTAEQINAEAFLVCFAHPSPKEGYERYAAPKLLAMRKPQPGMLLRLIERLGVPKEKVLVVGNYADDCRMAKVEGVAWELADVFFAGAERHATTTAPALAKETLGPVDNFDPFLDTEE